jgi:N-glycosylase/DNA lyase
VTTSPTDESTFRYPAGLLHLERTFANGQCFRWRPDPARKGAPPGEEHWQGIVAGRVIWLGRVPAAEGEGDDTFTFRVAPSLGSAEADRAFLWDYLRLDLDLDPIYADWRERDPYLGSLTERFRGLRILRQDPEECLLSFVCSTANAIPRIQRAIGELAREVGDVVTSEGRATYYRFPSAAQIAALEPFALAARTGLEWRAGNLVKVAAQVAAGPPGWLLDLRGVNYAAAHGELTRLSGVGAKIADCVCCFALDKDEAVPVDTHVFQLTRDRYMAQITGKSLTPTLYGTIVRWWRDKFGPYAGWAQQYLFYDHLLEARRTGRSPDVDGSRRSAQ